MSDDIISELVQLDEEARTAVGNAETQRDTVKARIEKETADVRETYLQRARHRIALVREEAQKDSGKQIAEIKKEFDAAQERLEQSFAKNHAQWVEEIVSRCRQTGTM